MIVTNTLKIKTEGENSIIDLTSYVEKFVKDSMLKKGIVTISVMGSTASITTMEYEEGLLKDLPNTLDRLIPKVLNYEHEKAWQDGNAHSHIKASIIGSSLTIPFLDSKLMLGTWQQIVLIEFDVRPRERTIVIQIIGE